MQKTSLARHINILQPRFKVVRYLCWSDIIKVCELAETHISQIASFTLRDGKFVYFGRTSEKSAELWDGVTFLSPFVGSVQLLESA